MQRSRLLPLLLAALAAWPLSANAQTPEAPHLNAQTHNSGFADAHDTYNGMSCASDGRIYYVLSSARYDVGAKMYVYDPKSDKIEYLADLTEVCGEKDTKTIVQGKSHVKFAEANGKLYFATHLGFYSMIDGMEKVGIPPEGWKPYPGGHLLSYDMATGQFEDFGVGPQGEGIITMSMDVVRGRIYGITWPTGHFFRYDLATKEWKDFGKITAEGEDGVGPTYRTLCRSIAVNPDDGSAYFTVAEGDIFRYDHAQDAFALVEGDNLRKDYFGLYDPTSAGHMGYNWRQTVWCAADKSFYGVHGNSGYLFRFDPAVPRVEVLDRITSKPSQLSGMFDQFSYGYLGFEISRDGKTLYYLTGGPIYIDGKRVTGKESTAMGEVKGLEDVHLITYKIAKRKYKDNGPIFYPNGDRPINVNSIAVTPDGLVGFLAHVTEDGKTRTDLVTVQTP